MSKPAVGLSYAGYIPHLLDVEPCLADYIEVPVEALFRDPALLDSILARRPVILHCASLSLAGNISPEPYVVEQLRNWISLSHTPWLGEHIAYVRTEDRWESLAEHEAVVVVPPGQGGSPVPRFDVGYTVSPQLSPAVLKRVIENASMYEQAFGIPVLLENGPVYFEMPGSTMSQAEFIEQLCDARPQQRMLLDLVHLEITCKNLGLDSKNMLRWIPADRVDEVHLSGYLDDGGLRWDDHASAARDSTFELVNMLLARCRPKAITLEYNWDSQFPINTVKRDIGRIRDLL